MTFADVVRKLEAAGFPEAATRAALPDWWEDDAWDKPSGQAVAKMHLARVLGVRIATLTGDGPVLPWDPVVRARFVREALDLATGRHKIDHLTREEAQ